MRYVSLGFGKIQGANVARRRYALAKLLHVWLLQNLPELRLTNQKTLQQRLISQLKVGEHSQLLYRPGCQVLSFVNNQQTSLTLTGLSNEIRFQRRQQLGLWNPLDTKSERSTHHAQNIL